MIPNQLTKSGWVSGYLEFDKSVVEVPAPNNLCGNFWAEVVPKCKIPFQTNSPMKLNIGNATIAQPTINFSKTIDGVKYNFRITIVHGTNVDGIGQTQITEIGRITAQAGVQVEMYVGSAVTRAPMYKWVSINFKGEGSLGYNGRLGQANIDVTDVFTEINTTSKYHRITGGVGIVIVANQSEVYWGGIQLPTSRSFWTSIGMHLKTYQSGSPKFTMTQSGYAFRYNYNMPSRNYTHESPTTNYQPSDSSLIEGWKQQAFSRPLNPYAKPTPEVVAQGFQYTNYGVRMARSTWSPSTVIYAGNTVPFNGPGWISGTNRIQVGANLSGIFTIDTGGSYPPRVRYNDTVTRDALGLVPMGSYQALVCPVVPGSEVNGLLNQFPSSVMADFEYVQDDPYNIELVTYRQLNWSSYNNYNYAANVPASFNGIDTITATYPASVILDRATEDNYSNYQGWQNDHPFLSMPSCTITLDLYTDGEEIDSEHGKSYVWPSYSDSDPAYATDGVYGRVTTPNSKQTDVGNIVTLIREVTYTATSTWLSNVTWTIESEQTFDENEKMSWYNPAAVNIGLPTTAANALSTGYKKYIPNFEAGDEIDLKWTMTNAIGTFQIPFKLVFDSDENAFQPELSG